MAIEWNTDTNSMRPDPRSPRIWGEPSTAASLTDDEARAWAKTFRGETLNFTTDTNYDNHVLGVDPFTRAEDGKYLVYLADDGTLKEMIPAERRRESLNDPEFCRRMATLSQEGRLFVRKPGDAGYRQAQTNYKEASYSGPAGYYISLTQEITSRNLQPREVPEPVAPKAPSRWKYLLYIFSKSVRDEFKKYNEDKRQFEVNQEKMRADREAYVENMAESLRQLDDSGLDNATLQNELKQQEIAKENWKYNNQLEVNREKLRKNGFSEERIQQYEAEMRRLSAEKKIFEEIRPLKFESDEQLIEIAFYAMPNAGAEKNLIDALKDMDSEFDASVMRDDRRAEVVKNCIRKNLEEINRYSAKDPEYRMLLEMNEALFSYAARNPNQSFRTNDEFGPELDILAKEHKLHTTVFNSRKATLDSKEAVMKEFLSANPTFEFGNMKLNLCSGILSNVLTVIDAVQKRVGGTGINPVIQVYGIEKGQIEGIGTTFGDTPTFQSLASGPITQILDVLTEREKMFEFAEKLINEPTFKMLMNDINLDEQFEEAKAFGLYGNKSTLGSRKIDAFKEYLNDTAAIKTATHTTDALKKEDATVESYCEAMAQSLEKQMAQSMLKGLENVPEQERNIFLVQHRRAYQTMAKGLREYVSKNVDIKRIQEVIDEGYEEGYKNNTERKNAIQQERMHLVNNGLKEFCQSKPELAAKLNQMQVAQQSAPQLQQVQQQMQQPEAAKAAAPSIG